MTTYVLYVPMCLCVWISVTKINPLRSERHQRHGQPPYPLTGSCKDGVGDRWNHRRQTRLTQSLWRSFGIDELHFNGQRCIRHTDQLIRIEILLLSNTFIKCEFTKQSMTN